MNPTRYIARLSTATQVVFIFLLSAILRVAVVFLLNLHDDPVKLMELQNIALSLAETGRFADPYSVPTGPTAHCAPTYVVLVSLLFKLFGVGVAGRCALMALNIAAISAANALLPIAAAAGKFPPVAGLAAGLIAALPLRPNVELDGWENALAALLIIICIIVTLRWLEGGASGISTGAVWGALVLTAPVAVIAITGILLLSVAVRWVTIRRAALATLTCAAILLPWTVRNYVQLGAFVFVRSNFGMEFALSNRDGAHPTLVGNTVRRPEFALAHHPYSSVEEATRLTQVGEAAYNRQRLREAFSWIEMHPGEFMRLTGRRIAGFWFMRSYPMLKDLVLFFPATILAFAGIVLLMRRNSRAAAVYGLILLLYPVVYYFVQLSTRYRYPLEGVILLLACVEVTVTVMRIRDRQGTPLLARVASGGSSR